MITRRIRDQIVTTLKSIGATENGTELQRVVTNVAESLEAYPSARVLPDNVENETQTNMSTERTAKFVILVHINLEDTPESEDEAYNTMYDLSDLIFNKFDDEDARWNESDIPILGSRARYGGYEILEMANGNNLVLRIDIDTIYSNNIVV